jgi:hypothetical protein
LLRYNLQDCLAGIVGGMMSIAVTKMKLHLSTQDNDFKIRKVSGAAQHVLAPDGKHVDIELREVRHGEKKEILVELELDVGDGRASSSHLQGHLQVESSDSEGSRYPGGPGTVRTPSTPSTRSGSRAISRSNSPSGHSATGDATRLGETLYAHSTMIEEVPVLDLDCSFADPSASKACTRLAKPLLLLLTLLPPSTSLDAAAPSTASEPLIVRRRMELLVSDMITRSLLLVSKRNHFQAQRLMGETRTIVHSVISSLLDQLASSGNSYMSAAKREKRDAMGRETVVALESVMQDIEMMSEGLDDESRAFFDRDTRCFAAQQVRRLPLPFSPS